MPYRRATRTLRIVAPLFWVAAITLYIVHGDDALRSLVQGIAATASIAWLILWTRTRDGRRFIETLPDSATWVSRRVPAGDSCLVTMEIPKVKVARMEEHVPARDEVFPPGQAAQIYEIAMQTARRRAPRS